MIILEDDDSAESLRIKKDDAYHQRNMLVALLARIYPSGIKQTPEFDPEWTNCVYIDTPKGQMSWHYKDSESYLFADLPPYTGNWDGHSTPEKYERVRALSRSIGVNEDDGTDPLTIYNLIQAHDARRQGFNWTDYKPLSDNKPISAIFGDALAKLDKDTDFELSDSVFEGVGGRSLPTPRSEKGVIDALLTVDQSSNSVNPNLQSNEPNANACPAYLSGFCRIDGRPCAFSNYDYGQCGKYYLASSGDPDLFEIPPGREDAAAYMLGINTA